MAQIYKTNGEVVDVKPQKGKKFNLEEMQAIVGGYIEIYHVNNDKDLLIINEEGKLLGLHYNEKATELFRKAYRTDDFIVGDALVCDNSMVD